MDRGDFLIGERAFLAAVDQIERQALLARADLYAAEDIEQLDGLEDLAAVGQDQLLDLTDGDLLIDDQGDVAFGRRILGQRLVMDIDAGLFTDGSSPSPVVRGM